MIINKLKKLITNEAYRFSVLEDLGIFNKMNDEKFLTKKFYYRIGYQLNLKNPKTYNEKLQWIKLNDRKEIYSKMVDKYEAKSLVANVIGDEYIIPTYGVWDKFADINFEELPDSFVIKCTHDSGGVIVVNDKHSFDISKAKEMINAKLKHNFYFYGREWPYKKVKPRIIIEKNMSIEENSDVINDYKIYTFNGKAKMCMINQDRGIDTRADYFDKNYNQIKINWGYKPSDIPPQKPKNYEKMFELAEKLAFGTLELRVDFYEINDQIYFGEMTFFDGSGFDAIEPIEWDYKMGSWIKLPNRVTCTK